MKIVADENIPYVKDYFAAYGEIILKPGRLITRADVVDADILLIRSVTSVGASLLADTAVKFVGSATTGLDHLDIPWLTAAGIRWSGAVGCNSTAVVEYVISILAALQKQGFLQQKKLRAGVIGVGQIGQQVVNVLKMFGYEVCLYDPLRPDIVSTPLAEFAELDFISLHTPLTKTGPFPTYHLLQGNFFRRQKAQCVLLNTGRGEAVSSAQLKLHGQHLITCLDVWEDEPQIDLQLLNNAVFATPHIAGYSVQSKYRGIAMLYQAALAQNIIPLAPVVMPTYPMQTLNFQQAALDWREVVLKIFDPEALTQQMKQAVIKSKDAFDDLRKNFFSRHEFNFTEVQDVKLSLADQQLLTQLGIKIQK